MDLQELTLSSKQESTLLEDEAKKKILGKFKNLDSLLKLLYKFLDSLHLQESLNQLMESNETQKKAVIVELKESLLRFLGVSGNIHGYHCLNLVNKLSYVLDIQ